MGRCVDTPSQGALALPPCRSEPHHCLWGWEGYEAGLSLIAVRKPVCCEPTGREGPMLGSRQLRPFYLCPPHALLEPQRPGLCVCCVASSWHQGRDAVEEQYQNWTQHLSEIFFPLQYEHMSICLLSLNCSSVSPSFAPFSEENS